MAVSNWDQSIRSASTYSGCSRFKSSLRWAPNNSHCGVTALGFTFFASFRDQRDQNLANFSATKRAMHPQISRKRMICQGRLNSLLLAEHDAERERRHAQAERKWSK